MSCIRTVLRLILVLSLLPVFAASALEDTGKLSPGVSFKLYHLDQGLERLQNILPDELPNVYEIRPTIDYRDIDSLGGPAVNFLVEVDAVLRISQAGQYEFRLSSDDGSKLLIDNEQVINHDGRHPPTPVAKAVELTAGDHTLAVRMFQAGGGAALWLEWKRPGQSAFEVVPAEVLFNSAGDTLKTTEGVKQVVYYGVRPRSGTLRPLDTVHPGFTLEQARPDGFKPSVGALAFLPDGRLAVTSFPPKNNGQFREEYNGKLYILDNPTATDTTKIVVHEITDQLHDPLGLNWHDGALYVADRNEVSKWTDTDGDGLVDKRSSFASGWVSDNYHHFTFGLPYLDGAFYLSLSTNISFANNIRDEHIVGGVVAMNGPNPPFRGCCLRIDAKTGKITTVSGGLRTPNGISNGPDGTIIIPDNQGAWKPASGIYVARPGAFFGYYNSLAKSDFYPDGGEPAAFSDQPMTPPAVYLPQNEASNSPGQLVMIPDGQPHAGQMLMAEVTLGGLRRVFFEEVNGVWQGAVFRHSQGFEAGLNRLAWGPDGCLYVGGMGQGAGNWGWRNKTFGLQRLRPTEIKAFEFEKIQATSDGLLVTFTKPVSKEQLEDMDAWFVDGWTYTPTPNYGGPKVNAYTPKVEKVVASADRLSARLVISDLKPNYVYHIRTPVTSDDGDQMWSGEAWYTLHQQPAKP